MKTSCRFVVAVLAGLLFAAVAEADALDDALEQAKKTGKPVLAIAGTKTCGLCVALKEDLKDPAYAPMLAQFVPLNLDYGDQAQLQTCIKLQEKYKVEGTRIPLVIVIRADGAQLYGKDGAPDSLPDFFRSAIQLGGKILPPAQLEKLAKSVSEAAELKSQGKLPEAVTALAKCLGTGSYAGPAADANKLAEELTKEAGESLKKAEELLSRTDGALDGILMLLAGQRTYAKLPETAKPFATAMVKHRKNKDLRDPFLQAEALDKARAAASDAKRATTYYKVVLAKYPGTKAAELATAELAALDAE